MWRSAMSIKTADLCDQHTADVHVAAPIFRAYGGIVEFWGPISTVSVYEDNVLVRAALETQGAGRVLVVDGGGSLRCAKRGAGEREVPVNFAGLTFTPGHYLYADLDGIVVSARRLGV